MPDTRATFSQEVRNLIEASGHKPAALGRLAGLNSGMIARFLANERGLTTRSLDALAKALNFGVAERIKPRLGRPPGRPSSKGPTA